MNIDKFSSESHNKYITVTLNYDEIRDLANALYMYTEQTNSEDSKKYLDIAAKMHLLFDLVKHGNIQDSTVKKYARLLKDCLTGGVK